MNAKQMFEELGYKRYYIYPKDRSFDKEMIRYRKENVCGEYTHREVFINIITKKNGVYLTYNFKAGVHKQQTHTKRKAFILTFEEHQAIHQQMKELGWLK